MIQETRCQVILPEVSKEGRKIQRKPFELLYTGTTSGMPIPHVLSLPTCPHRAACQPTSLHTVHIELHTSAAHLQGKGVDAIFCSDFSNFVLSIYSYYPVNQTLPAKTAQQHQRHIYTIQHLAITSHSIFTNMFKVCRSF